MTEQQLLDLLYQHQDVPYADFTARLIPSLPRSQFIGIRSPEYRKILRAIKDDPVIDEFLAHLPHTWHEENCLHAILLNQIKDYDTCLDLLERFLPYVNNWAVCDSLNPAAFAAHRPELQQKMQVWIASDAPYTRRFGMRVLMLHFLDEDFQSSYLEQPAQLRSDEYYVNMMTAWLFA